MFVVNVIKFITFHMNPRLTNISFSCKVLIIHVYMANFAGVNFIINTGMHLNVNTEKRSLGRTVLFSYICNIYQKERKKMKKRTYNDRSYKKS